MAQQQQIKTHRKEIVNIHWEKKMFSLKIKQKYLKMYNRSYTAIIIRIF